MQGYERASGFGQASGECGHLRKGVVQYQFEDGAAGQRQERAPVVTGEWGHPASFDGARGDAAGAAA